MTYVEAKFGLRTRDSKPSETGARGHCDLMDVDAVNALASGTGIRKESSSPRDGCFKCGGNHFQRDCNVHVTTRKGNGKKDKPSKSWPKECWQRKEQSKGDGKPKGKSKGSKSATSWYTR